MRTLLALVAMLAALAAADSSARAPQPDTLDAVAGRATAYVESVGRRLAGMIAEEDYQQEIRTSSMTDIGVGRERSFDNISRQQSRPEGMNHIRSDVVMVRPHDADAWLIFRDIFDVDSRPVHQRSDRLATLFVKPTASSVAGIQAIVAETAAADLGEYVATLGVPTRALAVLEPAHQGQFKIKKSGNATGGLPRVPEFAVPKGTWVIQFDEARTPALLHGSDGKDLPAHGRLWVEPSTGRIVFTEIVAENRNVHARVVVRYADAGLDVLAPREMREEYQGGPDTATSTRVAAYTTIRSFTVDDSFVIGR